MHNKALLVTEEGSVFEGISIGAKGKAIGELVFNTSVTGYQEIITDPSYAEQIVTLTHTHIGNVGINSQDNESDNIWAKGVIINELSPVVSSWRSESCLSSWLKKNNVIALAKIDTRKLTRLLRDGGALKACIFTNSELDIDTAIECANGFPGLTGMDLASKVSTKQQYEFSEPSWFNKNKQNSSSNNLLNVVVVDLGVKRSILQKLVDTGAKVTVVPADVSLKQLLSLNPNGIVFSNGPGDPAACNYQISLIHELLKTGIPIFGICLGHQLLALSLGAKTEKMKFGHHGSNHPVRDCLIGKVYITSQNHGFTVSDTKLPAECVVTHRSLFDNSIQGIAHKVLPVFGFQGHPEASPGPQDITFLFSDFIKLCKQKLVKRN